MPETSLTSAAVQILLTADPAEKVALSAATARAWKAGEIAMIGDAVPPARPARPQRPELLLPRDMPKRSAGGEKGRIALLHALAHIELNAIDLAWDIVARFVRDEVPRAFYDDWVAVAGEEALHHDLLAQRLAALGAAYGDLPAHDGLWQAAEQTADDLLARLAIVPLVLEARGLDVTPGMIDRLDRLGDAGSAAVLRRIYEDEIGHVATGLTWFKHLCEREGAEPAETYQALVRCRFKGALKPPFNASARARAGLSAEFYSSLAAPR